MSDLTQPNNVNLIMVRESVTDCPRHDLPSGYRFRPYRDGDVESWTNVHLAAEPFVDITPELFTKQFGDGLDLLSERMHFVETKDGQAVATITAWWEKDRDAPDERGRIHWVVVDPQHQGQGIAKSMMTYAMSVMSRFHSRAMLETSSGRPVAVKIYLDFGFLPDVAELEKPEILNAWQSLQTQLNHSALADFLSQHDNESSYN